MTDVGTRIPLRDDTSDDFADLFTEPMPAAQPLPRRQDIVMRAVIRLHAITADEAGQLLHGENGKHNPDDTCRWCGDDGKSVLKALAKKKLVTKRRDGTWTLPGDRARREHGLARLDVAGPQTPPAGSCSDLDHHGLPKGF